MPDERQRFLDAVHEPIYDLFIWNAPDHLKHVVRGVAWRD